MGQVVEEVVWERELTPYSDKDPENPTLPQGTCVSIIRRGQGRWATPVDAQGTIPGWLCSGVASGSALGTIVVPGIELRSAACKAMPYSLDYLFGLVGLS